MTDLLDLLFAEPEDDLARVMAELRWLVLKHPIAARSAVRALVAEGRAFATTEEGRVWRERLATSQLVQRGQLIWDVSTWNALESEHDDVLPTQIIDAMSRATARRDLETAIARRVEIDGTP